jgi:SAM-dependent methyltransferase
MEWFEKWFNEDYLDLYPHRNAEQAKDEIDFLVAHLGISPEWRIADIACASGRHSIALSERGFRPVGVDLSETLLRKALESTVAGNLGCMFLRGDMRSLPFQTCSFDLVLWLFNSFGYFDEDGNARSLREVARVTAEQGFVVLDYFNRDYIVGNLVEYEEINGDGWRASIKRCITSPPERVEKSVVVEKEGRERDYLESVRLYTPDEVAELCEAVGLSTLAAFAGFTPVPLHRDAKSMLLMLQKR